MDDQELLNTQNNGEQKEEKTFTQQEVEEILKKRLARERKKAAAEQDNDTTFEERTRLLEERELKMAAREKLFEAGLPAKLAEVLKYQDEETLDNAISTVLNLNIQAQNGQSWGARMGKAYHKSEDERIREAMQLDR